MGQEVLFHWRTVEGNVRSTDSQGSDCRGEGFSFAMRFSLGNRGGWKKKEQRNVCANYIKNMDEIFEEETKGKIEKKRKNREKALAKPIRL